MAKKPRLSTCTCLRCGYVWSPRRPFVPAHCARCNSPYWHLPRWQKAGRTTPAPLPVGTELHLTVEPRGVRAELRAGALALEARGDTAEAVLAELLLMYAAAVRKFVDEDLGIDRAAQARETKRQNEENRYPELSAFMVHATARMEAEAEILAQVSPEAWKLLAREKPGVIKRMIAASEALTAELKRAGAAAPN